MGRSDLLSGEAGAVIQGRPRPHLRVFEWAGTAAPRTASTTCAGQTPLPDDLEQAAVEQITYWFQNREHLGLKTYWPSGAAYQQFAALDLLDSVKATLSHHRRWSF